MNYKFFTARKFSQSLIFSIGVILMIINSAVVRGQSSDTKTGSVQPDMLAYYFTGETNPTAGYIYTYTVNPSALPTGAAYTVTNGVIQSSSTSSVTIIWNSNAGGTSGTITAKGPSPQPYATLTVNIQSTPLSAGYINPSSLNINYNTSPGTLTSSPAAGGDCDGSYGYQWQSSPDNSTWSNISGATSLNYTSGNLVATTYYRVYVTCSSNDAYTNTATITVYPPLNAGSVNPGSANINYVMTPALDSLPARQPRAATGLIVVNGKALQTG